MKKTLRYPILVVFILCAALCCAEDVTHYFYTMGDGISYTSSNKVATTSLTTYTCTGTNAKFWKDITYSTYISINLLDANDFVTTSAIEDLSGIQIWHYPQTQRTNITLQLSRDSVHWTEPIVQDGMYQNSWVNANFVPGNYYVRLTNTDGTDVSLYKIIYRFGSCNCVLYIPE